MNFFLASFFSSNDTDLLGMVFDVVDGEIVVNGFVGLILRALLMALLDVLVPVPVFSSLLDRSRFRVSEVSDSFGSLGDCSSSALGTAGTGMNWR